MRKRPRPDSPMAKSISRSRWNCSSCSGLMRPKQIERTAAGDSTCLLIGNICPSILILIGAFEVKNRSEARRSTISWNSGLVFSVVCDSLTGRSMGSLAIMASEILSLHFLDDGQIAVGLDRLVLALAVELDAQAQLVLGIGVAHRILIGDVTLLVQLEQRLVEGLHADAVRARHDLLDLGDIAPEDQVLDERRIEHDLHRRNAPMARFARDEALRDQRTDVQGHVHQQLLAPLFGKEVDDAVECL